MLLGRKGELSEEKAAGKNLDLSKGPGVRMEEEGIGCGDFNPGQKSANLLAVTV